MKPAKRSSWRGRLALGINGLAKGINSMALAVSGNSGGYESTRARNRRLRGFRTQQGDAASDIHPSLPELRTQSRELSRNSPIIAGARHTKVNGAIGTGLQFKSELDAEALGIEPDVAQALEDTIEAEFELFSRECDFNREQHFRRLQRVLARSTGENGDAGIARRFKRYPGQTYGTKLVLIEADRISNPHRRADTDKIKGGVQIKDGVVQGYWVTDRHPGDRMTAALNWKYVPRFGRNSGQVQMVLPFEHLRVGQLRGVPDLAPVITTIKLLSDYTEAEVSAALNDAVLFAFQKLTPDDEAAGAGLSDEKTGQPTSGGSNESEVEVDGRSLKVFDLDTASDIIVKKPERPNTQFEAFVDAVLKYIGATLQIPFELLLMHFSASYSASRAAMELAWKAWAAEREMLILGAFDVVVEWFFYEAVALGRIDLPGFFDDPKKRLAYMSHIWVPPTRIQIDPVKEATADETDIRNYVKTREQVITERTRGDWPRKFRQARQEHNDLDDAGMLNTGDQTPQRSEAARQATNGN